MEESRREKVRTLARVAPVHSKIRRIALGHEVDNLCLRSERDIRVRSVKVVLPVAVGAGTELGVFNGEIGPADAVGGTAGSSDVEGADIAAEIGEVGDGSGGSGSNGRKGSGGECSRRVHFVCSEC